MTHPFFLYFICEVEYLFIFTGLFIFLYRLFKMFIFFFYSLFFCCCLQICFFLMGLQELFICNYYSLFDICVANVFPVDYVCFKPVFGGCDVEEGGMKVIVMP